MIYYKEEFHPKFKSDLKKIDKSVIKEIKDVHLKNILEDPTINPKLKGELSSIYSYHFSQNRISYRIAYKIVNNEVIFYYMVAKRENFYKKLGNRI